MDDLEEAAENIHILVREALEVQHHLEGHLTPITECPTCARHDHSRATRGRSSPPTRSSALHAGLAGLAGT